MSKKAILSQIEQLQKQLKELNNIERTNTFIKLLKQVLLDDKCTIILQGHNEWQFQEKYYMNDIKLEHRRSIAKLLPETIKELEND